MKVTAIVTIGRIETSIRGDSHFLDGKPGDSLEEKGLGFWMDDFSLHDAGRHHEGRVFIPWSSCLYMMENNGKGAKR